MEDYSRAISDSTKTGQQKLLSQGQKMAQQSAKSGFAGSGAAQAAAVTGRDTIMDDFLSQQSAAQSSLFKGIQSERDAWMKEAGQALNSLESNEGTTDYRATPGYTYNPMNAPSGYAGGWAHTEPDDGTQHTDNDGVNWKYRAGTGWIQLSD